MKGFAFEFAFENVIQASFFARLPAGLGGFAIAALLCLSGSSAFGQAMPKDQVRILQEALIWTTDYEGLIDGKFGPETRQAINKYQGRIGDAVTGMLTDSELERLVKEGHARKAQFGFRQVTDSNVGVSVGIPLKLLSSPRFTKWGKHWESDDLSVDLLRFGGDVSLKDLHDRLIKINDRKVTYDRFIDDDWFVIAAFEGNAAVYIRANLVPLANQSSEIRGFSIWMSKSRPDAYQSIAPAMLSSFRSNDDTRSDVSPPMGGDKFIPAPPTLPVNPPPARPLAATGTAAQVVPCFKGLGDCPPVLNSFK